MSNTAQNLTWEPKSLSIEEFYQSLGNMSSNQIDVDPVGQRPDVESLSKSQGIIDTVIRGYDFGELKLRTLPREVHLTTNYLFRSIDGGHRKRAIRDFINGKFKTGKDTVAYVNGREVPVANLYYKELPAEVKKQFNNYQLRFTVYDENMSDEQAGETFRRTNITTDVNHQEMLNSYENNLVAKFVRETSRPIRGLNNDYHDLFQYTTLVPERKQKWWKEVSKRLADDERVTRILTFIYKLETNNPSWSSASNDDTETTFRELNKLWNVDALAKKRHEKQVKDALDFILKYAIVKKNTSKYGFVKQDFTVICRFYFYLVKTYGYNGFNVKDFDKLYMGIRNAMDHFVGSDDTILRLDMWKDNKGIRTVSAAFEGYCQIHNDHEKALQTMTWLLEEMGDIEKHGVILLDTKRKFDDDMIDQKLRQNGGVCEVDGKPLNRKDAVGAHIIPHCEGGRTTMDNLMVVRKEHNDKMGTMNALLYKEIYLSDFGGLQSVSPKKLFA